MLSQYNTLYENEQKEREKHLMETTTMGLHLAIPQKRPVYILQINRRDNTDGRAVALYLADPGSNPVVSMLQRA